MSINTTRPVQLNEIELEVVDFDEVIVLATLAPVMPSESFEEDLTTANLSELNKADTRKFIDTDFAELLNEQYELEESRLDYEDRGQI